VCRIWISRVILQSLHYSNIEEAGLDMLMLSAQAKYSEYLMENRQFEKKYQTDFLSFQKMTNQQIGKEDFEQEDDLNSESVNNALRSLIMLIPRTDNGTENLQCRCLSCR